MPRPIIIVALLAATAAAVRQRLRHVVVAGPSMLPTLVPGDRLVLVLVPGRPRVGDLVTTTDPRAGKRALLKRVHAVNGHQMDVRGDNDVASTDSRTFGMLPITSARRCVGWRYAPLGWAAYVGRRTGRPPSPRLRDRPAIGGRGSSRPRRVSRRRAPVDPRRSRRSGRQ